MKELHPTGRSMLVFVLLLKTTEASSAARVCRCAIDTIACSCNFKPHTCQPIMAVDVQALIDLRFEREVRGLGRPPC